MADNTLYNNLMRAGYAATGGTGAAFENLPDGSVKIHPATDTAWYGTNRLADSVTNKPAGSSAPTAVDLNKQQLVKADQAVEKQATAKGYDTTKYISGAAAQGLEAQAAGHHKTNALTRALMNILEGRESEEPVPRTTQDDLFNEWLRDDMNLGYSPEQVYQKALKYGSIDYAKWIANNIMSHTGG